MKENHPERKINMDIMDYAAKGIHAFVRNYGKKVGKKTTAPVIEDVKPVTISGSTYRAGFSTDEIMPDLTKDKTYWIAGHGSGHSRLYFRNVA